MHTAHVHRAQMERQVPLVITPYGTQAQMEHEQRELGKLLATIG